MTNRRRGENTHGEGSQQPAKYSFRISSVMNPNLAEPVPSLNQRCKSLDCYTYIYIHDRAFNTYIFTVTLNIIKFIYSFLLIKDKYLTVEKKIGRHGFLFKISF